MNTPNAFGYQENPGAVLGSATGSGSSPLGPNSMAQYKFSADEMRVLQECNRESFFQRSLPFSSVLGFGTFAAVQGGYLKPNPRFGAFPKVSLAVMVGYFIGKLSYQQACADKLMALPGSYIGQLLRDRRDGKIEGTSLASQQPGSMLGASPGDIYSDAGPGSALNLDTDRPAFSDDTYRPDSHDTNDSPSSGPPEPPASPGRSYDDLRRQNRGEFNTNKQDPYRVEGGLGAPPPPPRRAPPPRAPPAHTNQYGDALD